MAKNKKKEILEDVSEYLDEQLEDEKPAGIVIPPKVVEAMLIAIATNNRGSIVNVGNQIREICEKQGYAKF